MNSTLAEENKPKLIAEQTRIRAILQQQGKLEGAGEFPGEYKPEFPEFGRDDSENAQEVEQFGTNLALTQDLEQRLSKVEAALKRIADGTYGVCKFGDQINEDRLRAVPEADTCINHSK